MVWGCFSVPGTGNLVKVAGIMMKEGYMKILKDPKHTSLLVKSYFQKTKVNLLTDLHKALTRIPLKICGVK